MDLLRIISQQDGFEYEIYPVPDNEAGTKFSNGSWAGVMNQIISGVLTFFDI